MSIQLPSVMAMFLFTKVETGESSISYQNAPDCTKLHPKFQNFPGVTPPDLIPGVGDAPPQTPPSLGASRLDMTMHTACGRTAYKWTPPFLKRGCANEHGVIFLATLHPSPLLYIPLSQARSIVLLRFTTPWATTTTFCCYTS